MVVRGGKCRGLKGVEGEQAGVEFEPPLLWRCWEKGYCYFVSQQLLRNIVRVILVLLMTPTVKY
jgi:hypothetical protein